MADWIIHTIRTMGYPGLVLLALLECVFPPIPSELVLPFAGMTSTQGQLSLWGVILAGTLGGVLGAVVLYALGRRLGMERTRDWLERHGHWVGVSAEELDRGQKWFERHGAATVFFCRLLPAVRSLISVPAGIERMTFPLFLVFTTLGTALWTTLLAYAGRVLGDHYTLVERYLDPVSWVILGALTLVWLARVARRVGKRHAHPERQRAG
jgi:membrane protein DedA with SNARE-associated domain